MGKRNRRVLERDLYSNVATWLRRNYSAFHTVQERGVKLARIDVCALRDTGTQVENTTEVLAVEVKRGTQPFAKCAGQAAGYRAYAHRVWLAELRNEDFSQEERDIANHLDIGLLQLTKGKRTRIHERVNAPLQEPIAHLCLSLLENLGFATCRLCGTTFRMAEDGGNRFTGLGRENLQRALANDKALIYWLYGLHGRKLGREAGQKRARDRRYLCPDCVQGVFGSTLDPAANGG